MAAVIMLMIAVECFQVYALAPFPKTEQDEMNTCFLPCFQKR